MILFSLVLHYSGHTQVIFIFLFWGEGEGGGVVYRSLLAEVFGVRKWTALKRFNYSHSDTLFFQRTLASVHIFFPGRHYHNTFSTLSAEAINPGRPYWILHPVSCQTPDTVTTVFKCS
jgi:hypothetical protein